MKENFFSRFTGFRREKKHKDAARKSAERQNEPSGQASAPEAKQDPARITLAPESPFLQLWNRYDAQYPPPETRFDIPSALPAQEETPEDGTPSATEEEQEQAAPDAAGKPPEDAATANLREAARRLSQKNREQEKKKMGDGPVPLLTEKETADERDRVEHFLNNTAESRIAKLDEAAGNRLDADVYVFLPMSRIAAWIVIYPPFNGGEEVDADRILSALGMSHVCFGLYDDLLQSIPTQKDRYFHLYRVAHGIPPVHGKDGYVIDLFSRAPVRTLTEDDYGQVDYAAVETFQNVNEGDPICHIVPPTPCRDGTTVTGKVCYAHAGQNAVVPKGRNTVINEEGTSLVAARQGHVEFSGRSFQVKPVLDIGGSVDFSTGNISCLGDVHIRGDICSGFTVRATGSITVDGVVEACTVEAGTDLVVRKGVQGNCQAVLRAHRNVFAKYLESCSVYARENLESECVVSCNVYSDGSVRVRSGRGAIIGGHIYASKDVSANIIGARSECLTAITLGGRPCEAFEREELVREIDAMKEELEKLDIQPDGPLKLRQMSKVRMQISVDKMKLQQFDKEMESMKEELEGNVHGRITCSVLYPGAEITIGNASLKITQEVKACTAALKGDEIVLN